MMQIKRELFYENALEALEEIDLANAITQGRNKKFFPEEENFATLDR